jgi:hypothetical protein
MFIILALLITTKQLYKWNHLQIHSTYLLILQVDQARKGQGLQ